MITLSSQSSKNHPTARNHPSLDKARKQLEGLSDKKLLSELEKLDYKERRLKVLVLLYLSEINTRKLYLPLGFSSLFDFCTYHLRYTRATAARRIRSARAAAKYPEALALLLSGEINITTLSMIGDILDQDNHEEIFSEIMGKSTRQVELLVSRHRPERIARDIIRPVCVMRRVQELAAVCDAKSGVGDLTAACGPGSSAETDPGDPGAPMNDGRCKSNKISSSAETKPGTGRPQEKIIFEQKLKLGFTVSPDFMNKYNKIKSLLSSKHPEGINFEVLFDILMNEYLERHDPDKKRARRAKKAAACDKSTKRHPEKRREQKANPARKRDKALKINSINQTGAPHHTSRSPRRNSRHISPAVRDQVYTRDRGRCAFVGVNGTRCNSTWDLEIDHVVPFARGGDNSPGNLRLLCRKHNIYQAERTYGKEHMKNYIKNK